MRAAHYEKYRDLKSLKIIDVEKPSIDENEILIQVAATTVQTADWRVRTLEMPAGMGFMAKLIFGFNKPRKPILGTELAGRIIALGKNVTDFKLGDEVVAATGARFGAHAEYAKVPKTTAIALKPSNLSFQEAAAIPFGGITSLDLIKHKAQLKENEKILILGASGAVGVAAIQIAKILKAEVTAVCSPANFQFVKSLGADHAIDYSTNELWDSNKRYDMVFDVLGNLETSKLLSLCEKNGRLILVSASLWQMLASPFRNLLSSKKIFCGVTDESRKNLEELVQWAQSGKYKSVIGKEFSLDDIAQAHALVQSRHKRGNIVVNVAKI